MTDLKRYHEICEKVRDLLNDYAGEVEVGDGEWPNIAYFFTEIAKHLRKEVRRVQRQKEQEAPQS